MQKKEIKVVAAVIIKDGLVFATQRPPGKVMEKLWEFPGGKIEKNETPEEALIREIHEELNTTICVKEHFITVHHEYELFKIVLSAYLCDVVSGELTLLEHMNKKWLSKEEVEKISWTDADKPIAHKLHAIL